METFNFSDRDATVDKLQELGVLDRLEAMFRILRVAADRNEFIPYTRNTTKGSFHYDLVRSVMSRVTLTGEYQLDDGVEPHTEIDTLMEGLPPEARNFLPLEPTHGIYTWNTFKNVPYWEVGDFCSLIVQSANRFEGGVQGIRWERSTKQTIVAETQHHVGDDALFSPEEFDLDGFEASVPMHLPALVVAYNISPEGELLEGVIGVPTPARNTSDTPWLWTYDILARLDRKVQVAPTATQTSPVPQEQIPDIELQLKREATHE